MPTLGTESDYQAKYDTHARGDVLPSTSIEVVREPAGRGEYRHALFDFDGTVSLIREGWPPIMTGMMLEVLMEAPQCEPEEQLRIQVSDFVLRTMGMQTVYQMIHLAREVEKRGGTARDPMDYKSVYGARLMRHIGVRREALRSGSADPRTMTVPGAREFLEELCTRGVKLYLASGTDEPFVREEAELLGVAHLFEGRVYGAIDDYKSYSKAMVIERILKENSVDGRRLLGFGDGYVEIDNTKSAGGTGIGVATDESNPTGKPDERKRERLLGVGADLVIPDFADHVALAQYLMEA